MTSWLALVLVACTGVVDTTESRRAGDVTSTATNPATVIVHYPTGWGHQIFLRGSGGGLSWSSGAMLPWGAGDVWTDTLALSAPIELKPLFDDDVWAIGPNWTLSPGQTLDIWPRFYTTGGRIVTVSSWYSNTLGNARELEIYLPPSYDENPNERYPVVYMEDGQNLFFDDESAVGVSWNAGGAMDDGALDASIHEAILVGIGNTDDRTSEYTPVADPDDGGGKADRYLAFVINELKPWVDTQYRTYGDAAHTVHIGSSLAGLLSCYVGMTHREVFGSIGALSPSTWWDNNWIIAQVAGSAAPTRVYLDSGDSGVDNDDVTLTASLAQSYRSRNANLDYWVQHGAEHSEVYWRQRLPGALSFLLGGR